jgi:hypothetical protein
MEYIGSGIAVIVGTIIYNYRQRIAAVFKKKSDSADATSAETAPPGQAGGAKLRKKRNS